MQENPNLHVKPDSMIIFKSHKVSTHIHQNSPTSNLTKITVYILNKVKTNPKTLWPHPPFMIAFNLLIDSQIINLHIKTPGKVVGQLCNLEKQYQKFKIDPIFTIC